MNVAIVALVAAGFLHPAGGQAQSVLQWNGNVSSDWDVNATMNWLRGATASVFTNGSAVLFADSAATGSVNLAVGVQPASVTVSNNLRSYAFGGPGYLNGSASLVKQGTNTLTVRSSGSVSGWNIINGTLVVDGSAGGQTNIVRGELWVGSSVSSPAGMVLTNTSVIANSWLAVGRGNGTAGYVSSAILYNSSLLCTNASMGYGAGVSGVLQNPSMTLNGSSRLVVGGGTGFNIGESDGASAAVTLNDSSRLTSSGRVLLGMAPNAAGTLVLQGSSTMTNGNYASLGQGGAGSATLRQNAVWQNLGDFNVADTGGSRGSLSIEDNAQLIIGTLFVGKAVNSTGIVYQAGGTVLRIGGNDWRIGGNTSGGAAQVGIYNLSNGVLNAAGANFQVGAYGAGQLNQSGGEVYVAEWPAIGRFAGSAGVLNVSGGVFNQTAAGNALIIGEDGAGTLNLSGTGVVNCAGMLRVGNASGASGTVNLNGGLLATKRVYMNNAGASSVINFNGGTLRTAPGVSLDFLGGLTTATVQAGGAVVDSDTNTIVISQDLLDGGGSFTKLGSGRLTLSGSLAYTGPTLVSNGTLIVTAPNSFASASCTVAAGAGFGVRLVSPSAQLSVPAMSFDAAGTSLAMDFAGYGAQPVAPLYAHALTVNGTITVDVSGMHFTAGQFPLLKYDTRTGSGGFALGLLPAGMVAQLVTNVANKTIDLVISTAPATLPWQLKQAALMTDWAQQVNPTNVLSEYPRPQMQRADWLNLNGVWEWQAGAASDPVPTNYLSGAILVPFCMESAISGVMEHHDRAWYRREFTVPDNWSGQRILLHFEAVDWECEPFVNGVSLGVHQGGYDPFEFDITPYLTGPGPQTLLVRIYDPTDAAGQPRGKQTLYPGGIMYTPCSGIWQPVWLEPVPATSVADFHLVPDIDNSRLLVNVTVSGPTNGVSVSAIAFDGSNQVATATGAPGGDFYLSIPSQKLWSPTNPFLYDLRLSLKTNSTTLDSVESYFGQRKVSLGTNNGFLKAFLNNQFTFEFGPLDQGFWPDGIYTAPTDLALKSDIESEKAVGFNMVRKHIKVEPRRWYYWADKLGLMVWQDMPSVNSYTGSPQPIMTNQFKTELRRMVKSHWNNPSIIMWVIFNEAQGQHDTASLVADVESLDPSRLVNQASGNDHFGAGDILDIHSYPNPGCPSSSSQAVACGEFGGVGLGITNHTWASGWGYVPATNGLDLTARFEGFCAMIRGFVQNQGMSAAVYTQTTDVETELNGLYTYDRKVLKPDLLRMRAAIFSTMGQTSNYVVVPTSQSAGQTWKYTTSTPAADWYASGFNDGAWSSGTGGFGTAGTPGAVIGTTWSTADIWLRRTFDPGSLTPQQLTNLVFRVHHDEGVEIYINGVVAASATGYTTGYGPLPISAAALAAIVPGPNNLLAVHCHQTGGGQYIDAGIDLPVVVAAPPNPALPGWPENGIGLRGEYFNGTNFDASALVRLDTNINFTWGNASPGAGLSTNRFSARWTGLIQPRFSEGYTFHLTANDGCRLWIDNQLVIDKWHDDNGSDAAGSIALTGGQRYDIRVEYYDNANSAGAVLEWFSVSQAREVVPQGVLFQTNHPPVLSALADAGILAGRMFAVTNDATDPDVPAQALSFSLVNPPAGAEIDSATGLLTWRPAMAQAGAIYPLSVRVEDNGSPVMSATRTFNLTVQAPVRPQISGSSVVNGAFQFSVSGDAGPDYRVYYSTNLVQANWLLLRTTNPVALPFVLDDPMASGSPQRFYRIELGP